MLNTLTFDFWGTLYQNVYARDERLHILSDSLVRHDQPHTQEDLEAAYDHALTVWERVWREERGTLAFEQWIDQILNFLGATLPREAIDLLRRPIQEVYLQGNAPQPVEGVAEALDRLSGRYRMGLISDTGLTPGRVLREVIRRDGLLSYFDTLTFSDETGVTKPEPAQFLYTLEALNARPGEAAHVGDLPETDVVGARDVGMKAILFLGISDRQDGISMADASFERYDELEELLERF